MYWNWAFSRNAGHRSWKAGVLWVVTVMLAATLPTGTVLAASFSLPTGQQVILDMGTNPDQFRTNFNTTTQAVRSINNGNCNLREASRTGPLMTINGSGPIGFKAAGGNSNTDWLGLNLGGGGIPCARVPIGQWISFQLNNAAGQALEGRTFVQVDVSFNMKRDAIVRVELSLGGDPATETEFWVYSGTSITDIPGGVESVSHRICDDATGSDSGPDSNSVNCRETFLADGDRITFTGEDGEFSIGGVNSQTVWHLARTFDTTGAPLDCEMPTEAVSDPSNPNVTLQCFRMANLPGLNTNPVADCEVVDYNLAVSCSGSDPLADCSASFYYGTELNDPGNYEKLQFVCEMYTAPYRAFPSTDPDQPELEGTGPFLAPVIQQYFGPSDSRGVDQNFCPGVTPHFVANGSAIEPGPNPDPNGGGNVLVNDVPALDQYQSFDVPAGVDHCVDATCGVSGQQVGCTIDRRFFQVEDQTSGVSDDGIVQNWVFEFIRWYLRGDYKALLTR